MVNINTETENNMEHRTEVTNGTCGLGRSGGGGMRMGCGCIDDCPGIGYAVVCKLSKVY